MNAEIKRVKQLCEDHGWGGTIVEDAMILEVKRIHAKTYGTRINARAKLWKTLETMNGKGSDAFQTIRAEYTF